MYASATEPSRAPPRYAAHVGPDLATATAADGVTIAWTSFGTGPTLIHLPGVPFSNVEGEWRIPVLRDTFGALGREVRLIQYDGRGTGRSQHDVTKTALEAGLSVHDLPAPIGRSVTETSRRWPEPVM